MSDLVPFDIQTEIIKKLPIKSLIRFRSVSKPWKSLIDSSKFIHDNCLRNNQPHHLLVCYNLDSVLKYVSIMDDDSFPQHEFSPIVPVTLNRLRNAMKLGSSHGMICFYGLYPDIDNETKMVVLWNPTIRKSVGIVIPNVIYMPLGYIVIGFGVCPNTNDPKLIKITHINKSGSDEIINCVCWEAEVFTLSSGDWRSVSIEIPSKPVRLSWGQVFINGVIYWHGYDKIDVDEDDLYHRIISFDLKSEEFGELFLPDSLARFTGHMYVSKLMDSLVVIIESFEKPACDVWKMNDGVTKSWTKLYTVKASDSAIGISVLEFRKNGESIMEVEVDDYEEALLQVYEPYSGSVKDLRLNESKSLFASCSVSSYKETLALLHQSDSIIY
ncbi:putative F-box protein At1g47790 [Rutidosis leptorrhynchoides]|uniref:putative F-box protein At1g47790 n=1 Tax=Rutidosis leptorrhynchoides TaxID=125765 RepID=UPI003A9A4930